MTDTLYSWMNSRQDALKVYKQLKQFLKQYLNVPYKFKLALGGSVAKCTSLNYSELDIYVYAPKGSTDLVEKVLNLNTIFEQTEKKYATDPYITILNYKGFNVDVVPVIKQTASMQYSLSHVSYIRKHLKNPQEVILLKTWLINNSLYHSVVPYGISGYISELLIIKFENFNNLFKQPEKVYEYLKTIKDPTNDIRHLHEGVGPIVKRNLYLKLKGGLCKIPFQKLMKKGLNVAKLEFSYKLIPRLKTLKTYCKKFSIFFEYTYSLKYFYILYFSTKHIISYTRSLNSRVSLEDILQFNYLSPTSFNEFTKLYELNFSELVQGAELIHELNIHRYKVDIQYLEHEFITRQSTVFNRLST